MANQINLTIFSGNSSTPKSIRCKCRLLTLAKAPGELYPIRSLRFCNLANNAIGNSSATELRTCGSWALRSGQMRQWFLVSGLLLTMKWMSCFLYNISKRRSPRVVFLKLKASWTKSGLSEWIDWGRRRRLVLFGFS